MRIDFLGVEAFLSIAERGSFQRAATHLNLSQTALSHRIRKLETDLGVRLFTRTGRQVTLTPAGAELLPGAREMLQNLTASYEALKERGQERQKRLAFGCLPTITTYRLPPLLASFSALRPEISVHIHDNSANEIATLVKNGEAEFGITVLSAARWDLEMTPLMKERYLLLCPEDHPLAQREAVGWSDIEGEPLVRISPQASNRTILDEALGSRREHMRWRYEVQHLATAVSLVAAGIALTVAPSLAVDPAGTPGVRTVAIRNPIVSRTLGLVVRRGYPLSEAANLMLGLIRRDLADRDSEG